MRQTLDSVVAQSLRPAKWVIVDDGSTDETPQVLAEYARLHDWIVIVTRSDRGRRAVGPGVIDAFYAGLDTINLDEFEFLCKLDLDLELPQTYFEQVIAEMDAVPRLANFSGKPYLREKDGRLVSERLGDENAVGQVKFYRVIAFKEMGGFVRQVSWDGIDGHMCRMKGWIARSEDRPELRFIHLRYIGCSRSLILSEVGESCGATSKPCLKELLDLTTWNSVGFCADLNYSPSFLASGVPLIDTTNEYSN